MKFSGKIANSVIAFMQAQGSELGDIYEATDLPVEFLKDPSCWLDAHKVEKFLQLIENQCLFQLGIESPLEKIGHASRDLKSWGVLDSVLRMIEDPQDIFLQPQRFISYFISPAPPIANIHRDEHQVSFDLPISFEEYPLTATYLCAAIESVPLFMGAQMAEASWQLNRVRISWRDSQSLFADAMDKRHIAPEVMQNLISTLEKTELALLEKTRELETIKAENALAAQSQVSTGADEIRQFRNQYRSFQQQVLKLQDYFTRSQQLITLLVAQDRMNTQVREAMRRMNWEQVQKSFAQVTQGLLGEVNIDNEVSAENEHGQNFKSRRERDSRQSWFPNC